MLKYSITFLLLQILISAVAFILFFTKRKTDQINKSHPSSDRNHRITER